MAWQFMQIVSWPCEDVIMETNCMSNLLAYYIIDDVVGVRNVCGNILFPKPVFSAVLKSKPKFHNSSSTVKADITKKRISVILKGAWCLCLSMLSLVLLMTQLSET